MKTHSPQNERIKRAYFTYLAEAKGFSEATLDAVAKALNRFETYTKFRDFKAFHIEQARGFKASLADQTSVRTKDRLSKATLYATLTILKRFFIWLAGQPGYKSKILYSDAEYFNLSAKETRIAKAHREARVPTLEQIRYVIRTMPTGTEIERRDRTLVAFTILTGARDGAIASLKLKHIDIDQGTGSIRTPGRSKRNSPSRSRPGSFPSATTSARSSPTGSTTCGRRSSVVSTIRCSQRLKLSSETRGISRRRDLTASTGAVLGRSGQFSRAPSRPPICHTSTRTAFGRPWRSSVAKSTSRRRNTRHGPRTSAMKTC